jgi:hypothetical protein
MSKKWSNVPDETADLRDFMAILKMVFKRTIYS